MKLLGYLKRRNSAIGILNVEIVDEIIEIVVNPEGKIHSYEAPEIPQES